MARFTCFASYEPVFVTPTAELITVYAGERVVLTAPGSSVANSLLALPLVVTREIVSISDGHFGFKPGVQKPIW